MVIKQEEETLLKDISDNNTQYYNQTTPSNISQFQAKGKNQPGYFNNLAPENIVF